MGAIPIINENDTVATDEFRFGDNDTLAALVANLVEADAVVILTDQQGLYNKNPRQNPDAKLICSANASDPRSWPWPVPVALLGSGGMRTKITAAQRAARSGAATLIVSGRSRDVLLEIARGAEIGTLLSPTPKNWPHASNGSPTTSSSGAACSSIAGASTRTGESGVSLLAVGVTSVNGQFQRGDMVSCLAPDGHEIARGLVNYSADEARRSWARPRRTLKRRSVISTNPN